MRPSIRAACSALALAALVAALTTPAGAGPLDSAPRITAVPTFDGLRAYPTIAADGSAGPAKTWFVTDGSGNCCENYLAANHQGVLVNVGGGVRVSTDRGDRWSRVLSQRTGSAENEGAVTVAPGGDIIAVEWGAFTADRLQSYKYVAATGTWLTSEVPLHTPFYDRPWLGVLAGPFATATGTVPYISVLRGGWPSKDLWLYSTDGLNYERLGNAGLEAQLLGQTVAGALPVVADPDLDWVQGMPQSQVTSLADGGLGFGPGCEVARMGADATWDCATVAPEIADATRVLVDSRGWIHAFAVTSGYVWYRVSGDGGLTWEQDVRAYPDLLRLQEYDVKVSAAAGFAALAVHGQGSGSDQDFVMRWDIAGARPSYLGTDLIGRGDLDSGAGITETGPRFDFASLTILPGGKIAVSFADSEFPSPAIAIG